MTTPEIPTQPTRRQLARRVLAAALQDSAYAIALCICVVVIVMLLPQGRG